MEDGSYTHDHQDRLLPMMVPDICACQAGYAVQPGKPIILIGMNGKYHLSLPSLQCNICHVTWNPGLSHLVASGYWPATPKHETVFEIGLFSSYGKLKLRAPGLSRQAFLGMLEDRTLAFGRTGSISGDAFQKAFLEWQYATYVKEGLTGENDFKCHACSPSMHGISVDGNRKLYRFKNATSMDKGLFSDIFIAKDEDVSGFVDHVHGKHRHIPGKGACGSSSFGAAKEVSTKSSSKIDEEGLEIAVCRHGVLTAALNMFRGEIFAYPLFLQNKVSGQGTVTFFCSDVACRYWPYLQRVASVCPELKHLLGMHPLLSVMHAKAHEWTCEVKWSGRNQPGAGLTIGEEVEQVNAYLSRAGVCTKYMSKATRNDMLTVLAMEWNKRKMKNLEKYLAQRHVKTTKRIEEECKNLEQMKAQLGVDEHTLREWAKHVQEWVSVMADNRSCLEKKIQGLHLSLRRRHYDLYHKLDSSKKRHRARKAIRSEKASLEKAIGAYNQQHPSCALPAADDLLQQDHFLWPWDYTDGTTINAQKKSAFEQIMLLDRLKEEEQVLLTEMKRHWQSLQSKAVYLQDLSTSLQNGSKMFFIFVVRVETIN
ncbi:hypothetical protein ACEWY4_013736 [Coilia grayii]|uniref:CxC3 like cysteine cluster domain-containing protein n=1 Tax=Coilia grayii TaxID=363190 RepID=A0ABD1JXN4_9TELE